MNEHSFIFTPQLRPKDENKVAAIRKKAIGMIVKEGFDGLSMQKLAKKANVSPATIYIYFKDREDLINQLYNDCQETFERTVLENFDPEMHFEEGLWLQWKNRYRFLLEHPNEFSFMQQFRNSPLIHHKDVKIAPFKEAMGAFVKNAYKRNELKRLPTEVFWSLAYGPFYALLNFHLGRRSITGKVFQLSEKSMKQAFELVIQTLKH